uniref:EGF-like domain-containing protein n=1 Tax=uncultured Bacteroidota bacterium TaxID=152509 RepID=H5SK51_9BACT|nr:hypothetical protein HGMM_F40B03C25 [uncultured Bacteroidetes bacterium]
MAGACQCSLPYEGTACDLDSRDKFEGVWEGRRACLTSQSGLRYQTWKDSLNLQVWLAGPFWGSSVDTLAAQLTDPVRLRIPLQLLRDTSLSVEGWASQRWDSLLIDLEVRGGTGSSQTCLYTLKRRTP